jgi:hypothetical protein
MINLSEQRVIEDAFFRAEMNYYKPSVYKILESHFREENDYSEASDVKLKNLARMNNVMAYNTIMKEDIKKIQKNIAEAPKQFDEGLWRDMLPKIREEVKKTLGMEFKTRSVFFENAFPEGLEGFEAKGASSVTIFEGQKDAGIYFLNKRVSLFTPILMIHEQLHSCLSQNKNKEQMYIEWFEEALCQWYSMKIYYDLTKNMDILRYYKERCVIFHEVKDEHNFTKRYFEYMKIFSRLYLQGGQKLIGQILLSYLANERDEVNAYINVENLPIRYMPKDDMENFLVNFSFYVEPEKIPPIEYLILREVMKPKTIEDISKKIKVPPDFLQRVIFALHFKGMLVMKDEKNREMNWRKKDLFEKGLIKPFWPLKGG